VRVDGLRSQIERFTEFEAMVEAGRQWLCNDEIAWVSLNEITRGPRGGRQAPRQTHIMVRRGEDEVEITEQEGRLDRVRRATRSRSPGMVAPV
jgi:hypothetical protein